jgi:hypothetical protein
VVKKTSGSPSRRARFSASSPNYEGLAEVDVERLGELVTDAWRMRAPDALVSDPNEADDLSSSDLG